LSFYSKTFDLVEVNLARNSGTQTATPSAVSKVEAYEWLRHTAKKWHSQTPANFRFSITIPEDLLFSKQNDTSNSNNIIASGEAELGKFLEWLAPVEEKILSVLIRVPTSITLSQGREWLENVLGTCTYHGYSAAVQFNHSSWYQDLTYNILKKNDAALVWANAYPHPVVTSDFLYLRLMDNNRNSESIWIEKIREAIVEEAQRIDSVAVVLDTPVRVNAFLKSLGLPERKYAQKSENQAPATLSPLSSPKSKDGEEEGRRRKNWNWKEKIVFCVDLNAFYPSCEELRDPALKGKPHAVIMTDEQAGKITKGVVSSCSYEARK
jgi:uncharacterized protein YecE (DUF72 family)